MDILLFLFLNSALLLYLRLLSSQLSFCCILVTTNKQPICMLEKLDAWNCDIGQGLACDYLSSSSIIHQIRTVQYFLLVLFDRVLMPETSFLISILLVAVSVL